MIAVVLGGADTLRADVDVLLPMLPELPVVLAVNRAGIYYTGRIDHWVTLHPENFPNWESKRTGNLDYLRWSIKEPADRVCELWVDGSSGLAAVGVARKHLRCERVVACGVPIDLSAHVGGHLQWRDKEVNRYRKGWNERFDEIKDPVRSMSGWTRDLLGAPTAEWLRGHG